MSAVRFLAAAALLLALHAPIYGAPAHHAGGPCAYDAYPGTAVITDVLVRPLEPGEGGQGDPPLRVTFVFIPEVEVASPLFQPGRERRLTLVGGGDPGAGFVAEHRLAPGRRLTCRMLVITKGTCTPVLFSFPGLDGLDFSGPR